MKNNMKKMKLLAKLVNFWPPYLGAGIKVKMFNDDLTYLEVQLKLRWWNKNYMKTHFGGSLYAMTDPFFMLMLIAHLGKHYLVWDKAANIAFKKPAKGIVTAKFYLPLERIQEIRDQADNHPKVEPSFLVQIIDEQGDVVTEVEKLLYVKRKDKINHNRLPTYTKESKPKF